MIIYDHVKEQQTMLAAKIPLLVKKAQRNIANNTVKEAIEQFGSASYGCGNHSSYGSYSGRSGSGSYSSSHGSAKGSPKSLN